MNYDAVFQKARALATMRATNGEPVTPDDTVCIISSQSGRMYAGLSRYENLNGMSHNIHAEAEAIRNLQLGNEAVVEALLLLSVTTGMPLLPCEHCLRSVLMLHPDNVNVEILMPDRAVPIKELIQDADKFCRREKPKVEEQSEGTGVLMDHVNSLLRLADEDEDEDDDKPEEKEKSGGWFGGLFRKKKKE